MRSVLVPIVCFPGLAPACPMPWTSGPTHRPSRPPAPHPLECSVYADDLELSFLFTGCLFIKIWPVPASAEGPSSPSYL
uniref:Secreted protein n=1 Tax=Macaca fascicularis TaxID=9541 RepID=Q2PG18_MACFA|nr:hypothetical protein [Macaca fascicularis]